jgi:hypothetical protein
MESIWKKMSIKAHRVGQGKIMKKTLRYTMLK